MIFVKVDVALPSHYRFLELPAGNRLLTRAAAIGVYVTALCFTREHELDGFCPLSALRELATDEILDALVAQGLMARGEQDGRVGVHICKYAEHNETRADIDSRKRATRAKVQRHREGLKGNPVSNRLHATGNRLLTPSESESESESEKKKQTAPLRLVPAVQTPPAAPAVSAETASQVQAVFQHWAAARAKLTGCKATSLKLTSERRRKVQARLRDGYTAEQLCQAIDGMVATPFNVEGNFTDLELACRDASHVDRYLQATATAAAALPRAHRPAVPVEVPADVVTGAEAEANFAKLKAILAGAGVPPWEQAGE